VPIATRHAYALEGSERSAAGARHPRGDCLRCELRKTYGLKHPRSRRLTFGSHEGCCTPAKPRGAAFQPAKAGKDVRTEPEQVEGIVEAVQPSHHPPTPPPPPPSGAERCGSCRSAPRSGPAPAKRSKSGLGPVCCGRDWRMMLASTRVRFGLLHSALFDPARGPLPGSGRRMAFLRPGCRWPHEQRKLTDPKVK